MPSDEAESSQTGRTPFSALAFAKYSALAKAIVDMARRYARTGRGSGFASSRSLLVAMLLTGKRKNRESAATWFWQALVRHQEALERLAAEHFPGLTGLSLNKMPGSVPEHGAEEMTSDLAAILTDAEAIARDHTTDGIVGARHLLGSLLIPRESDPTNSDNFLVEAGVDLNRIRREFVSAVNRWNLGDDIEAWRKVLQLSDDGLDRLLSGYTSDDVAGDDLIGITREVEAMASLAAAWTVEPPLSIGLFGEWGSGKSFFMQKMKERIRHIAAEARRSEIGQCRFGYYKNIVQVEFNAWHYVEGNLWASLVEHIFQNLRVFENDDAAEIEERQRKLFSELRRQEITKDKAEKAHQELRAQQTEKEKKRDQLVQQQHAAEERAHQARDAALRKAEEKRVATSRDVFEEVYGSQEVREQVKNLLRLSDKDLETAGDVQAAMNEATENWNTLREGWRVVTEDRGGWKILVLVLAVPVTVALLGWIASRATGGTIGSLVDSLATAVSTVFGLAAAAVVGWKQYSPRLKPILDTANKIRETRLRLDRRVEAAKQERDKRVAELDAEAEQRRQDAAKAEFEAKAKALEAQRAAEEVTATSKKIEDLRKQIDDLRPERMIASFIQDRAAAEDYRKHLGVPALIRRDFEKLSGMFRAQRKIEADDKDGLDLDGKPIAGPIGTDGKALPSRNDPTVVNRIILYVDDLDRCPPNKVVQVLRAIHLLLAFPLFVVVVAVDARWIRRSLKDQFKLMLSAGEQGTDDRTEKEADERDDASPTTRKASTDDYLEKIFQVPFWLQPLSDDGCRDLLTNLIPRDPVPGRETQGNVDSPPNLSNAGAQLERSTDAAGHEMNADSTRRAKAVKPTWTPVIAQPKTLQITDHERQYMLDLAPIIGRSPRAVKRFINCYRLAKAMLEPDGLEWFSPDNQNAAGNFHCTMFLLAMVSGAPEVATLILDSLKRSSEKTAKKWLDDFRKSPPDHDDWRRAEPFIAALIRMPGARNLKSLKDAADRVDRFAFTPIRARTESTRKEAAKSTTA